MAGDLEGFADLHTHLMGHLASGGKFLYGQPYDSDDPETDGVRSVLTACPWEHQPNLPPELCHGPGGLERFEGWPRYSTRAHQKAYVDWVKRAWKGGLRLVCCSAVNNELLPEIFGSDGWPTDDKARVELQISAMKEMVGFIDRQCGGHGRGWMEIAYSPQDARRIIEAGRLAVVLGVEVDSLGNWRTPKALPHDAEKARLEIRRELKRLYDRGVRLITPIHNTDNAFGGTAVWSRFCETLNKHITGEGYKVASASGVEYRLEDEAHGLLGRLIELLVRMRLLALVRLLRRLVVGKRGWRRPHFLTKHLFCKPRPWITGRPTSARGQANTRALTAHGQTLITEMMRLGIIIDIDHMSQRAADQTLGLAESFRYPVVATHTMFRDLAWSAAETSDVQKVASEWLHTSDTVERIGKLGGMVAPMLSQGDVKSFRPRGGGPSPVPNDCAGSSKSWAQAYLYAVEKMGGEGVGLGTDINGLAYLPSPRFGDHAAQALVGDACREGERKKQIKLQDTRVDYHGSLKQSRVGEHAFDINTDGVAHYGMLPDFLQDLQNIGLTEQHLAALCSSAEYFVYMWEKCEQRGPTAA